MRYWPGVLLALPLSLAAAQPEPDDFAYGLRLAVNDERPIQRLLLPEQVYRSLTRRDLGDMRLYNAAGEAVPHNLRHPLADSRSPEARAVPFFPLAAESRKGNGALELITDDSGTILRLQDGKQDPSGTVGAYVFDLSDLEQPAVGLELAWEQADGNGLLDGLNLHVSNDLQQWRPLAEDLTLARLRFQGHELVQNRVDFSATNGLYLRLSWPAEAGARLTDADVLMEPEQAKPTRQWLTLEGEMEREDKNQLFRMPGYFPVDRIDLAFREGNNLARVAVSSRPGPESAWHIRHRGIFYRLHTDNATLESNAVPVRRNDHRYWRVNGTLEPVRLRLGWTPHELLFLARGEGPYTLAFGSTRAAGSPAPVTELLNDLSSLDREVIADVEVIGEQTLGGAARLKQAPPPWPWRQWLLWGILIAGVGLLTALVLRLVRDDT